MTEQLATPRTKVRLIVALASVGAILWMGGAGATVLTHSALGMALRVAAILLLTVAAFRRSSLIFWTFLAMLAGVELGLDAPGAAAQTHILGDLFLRLIRMIVAPLLFATITTGIAGHSQLRNVGRVALKALIYFEVITTLGLIVGALAMNISGAGWGIALPATQNPVQPDQPMQSIQTWQQIVVNLVPENIAQAVAQNQILQVAVFSLLFGVALALLPETRRAPLLSILQSLAETMFQMTRMIMYLAPLATGAALAYTVGSMGVATLLPLGRLVFTCYIALAAFAVIVLVPILVVFRIPIRRFIAATTEPAAIAFATTSSEATLPLAMERMEQFGVPRWIVSFVMPTGYSFNMTGTSIYLSMAAVFVAQAAGIHLGLAQQIAMLATLMLASKGVAGVPRAVLIILMATAGAVHIPTAPILLILGIDALMDMGRTMMNVIGNCMACAVLARSEGILPRVWEPMEF